MIFYKTNEEIELIRTSCLLVAKTHAEVAKLIQSGIRTSVLDSIAEEFIRDNGGIPAFKGYKDFPNTLCVSINDQVVHGIPGDTELKDGDILSVDCGVLLNGFFGDSAYTYTVGDVSEEVLKLLKITKEALYKGIEMSIVGKRVGDISFAIQQHAESNGYSVVRELVGHGLGKSLHEKPEVPNYGKRGAGAKLKEGMVIAIEPMINAGKKTVKQENNGWTVIATDGMPSAHYEHSVAIRKDKADILSTFQYIEEVLKHNKSILV
ncbi:MAG: type I methionyl aminopeptidase [Bacteroidota bacterium]